MDSLGGQKNISIPDDVARFQEMGVLNILLQDRTTGKKIVWATSAYENMGYGFGKRDEICARCITGKHAHIIRRRAQKDKDEKSALTKKHAEVFTPAWVVKRMVDEADAAWVQHWQNAHVQDEEHAAKSTCNIPEEAWQDYVASRRLEITCGEAPYLVNRYDAASGTPTPLNERTGILSRKLALVNAHAKTREEWLQWAETALKSVYGYEFQGNNLLIARINALCTMEDYFNAWQENNFAIDEGLAAQMQENAAEQGLATGESEQASNARDNAAVGACEGKQASHVSKSAATSTCEHFTKKDYEHFAEIISWNLWQMNGLSKCVPVGVMTEQAIQPTLFDFIDGTADNLDKKEVEEEFASCIIYDWEQNKKIKFNNIQKGASMKFDYIIGNPPYQEEGTGDNKTFAAPIYHSFMDEAYKLSDVVELITPARFLFNAGSTPKAWNLKMLNDPHFKVVLYEPKGSNIFPNTDIKGGVAITIRNTKEDYGAIEVFTAFPELSSIYNKAATKEEESSLSSVIYTQLRFDLDILYDDYPQFKEVIGSNGKDKRFRNNIFDKINIFTDEKQQDDDIKVIGIQKNKRVWKYINKKYVDLNHESLAKWKVLVPRANGSGALGEVLSTPLIGQPLIGHTQSFISIGAFDTEYEASAAFKYIKGKFSRALLGILKITQDNDRGVWRLIPLQDFTSSSDIDWTQSVAEIDAQLYKKYGLSEDEIHFIETHVKEMD